MANEIVNNKYFKGEIYIPHAKPTVTGSVVGIGNELIGFIQKYEKDCLVKSFGYSLYKEFYEQLDSTQDNGLKVTADEKWDFLLNGKEYTNEAGDDVVWEGIRRVTTTVEQYDSSFLAYYIYWYYEKNFDTTRGGVGDVKVEAKNATRFSPNQKITNAYQNFIEIVQGCESAPDVYVKENGMVGVDYYGQSGGVITLYQFIRDMNSINGDDYYDKFSPKVWGEINQFGI